jgi:hypothetical protein
MNQYDFKAGPKPKRGSLLWNLLTVLVLISVICLAWYILTVFTNPYSSLNPFPPQKVPTLYQTITPTITIIQQEPTWTSTQTTEPTATRTKAPTWTQLPEFTTPIFTATPEESPTEGEPTISPTPMPASAEITYEANTVVYPDSACDWLGVGGQVLDMDGKPLQFQTVQLGGTLEGNLVSRMTLSGNAPDYGESGFEFVLADHPIASSETLWVQLFDNAATALTDKIFFDTYDNCEQNLVLIVFTKNR